MSKIVLEEQATPSVPSVNKVALYPKTGGGFFKKDDAGTEEKLLTDTELTSTSGILQSQIDCKSDINHIHDDRYYTESEVNTISGSLSAEIDSDISVHSLSGDHDDRYYTETEVDDLITTISGKLDDHDELNNLDYASAGHTGFQPAGDYLTETEINTISGALSAEIDSDIMAHSSDTTAVHGITDTSDIALKSGNINQFSDITSSGINIEDAVTKRHDESHSIVSHSDTTATGAELDELTGAGETSLHIHDDRYYTESEVDDLITTISGKLDDHDELNNLDYASSGHTGFQPAGDYVVGSELTSTSGTLQSQIDGKSDTGHTHIESDITNLDKYTQAEVDTISGTLNTKINEKDNYQSWTFQVDGVDKDDITSGDKLNFVGGDNIIITRSADDEITISGTSGGSTNHSELNELDFASAGHTGFASVDDLTTVSGDLQTNIDGKSDTGHNHDDKYYTETELNNGQLDNRYYIESEVDTISGSLSAEIDSDISTHASGSDAHHNESHTVASHSDTTATGANLNELVGSGDTSLHKHDDRYYTETEVDTISGTLNTKIDGKDNYSNWSFAVDGVTKDAVTSEDVLDFVGGDNIEITRSADDQITISGTSAGLIWTVISSDTNAVKSYGYLINATGGNITLTLPASPSEGDTIGACDTYNQATTNTLTIGRNGQRIEGTPEDLIIDISGSGFVLVYTDIFRGWEIVSEAGRSDSDVPSTTGHIGIPGTKGFGVGTCSATVSGMGSLAGTENRNSDEYGNYEYSDGSIMCWIPKFYYRIGHADNPTYSDYGVNSVDIKDSSEFTDTAAANTAGYALHRAFIDGGFEQQGFFYDKYMCSKNAWGTGQIASSLSNGLPISTSSSHNPIADLTACAGNYYYETINAAHARDGVDGAINSSSMFYVTTMFQNKAIALLSLAHGQAAPNITNCAWYDATYNFPKGCNNDALKDYDEVTNGAGSGDDLLYITDGYSNCGKTGSGVPFAKSTHNGQACGVADVNGLMYEINLGLVRSGTTDSENINDELGTTKFYILKESVSAKDLTSGWTTASGTVGSTAWGDAAYLEGPTSSYDLIDLPMIGKSTGSVYFGNGANQVLDATTSGTGWLRTGLGIYLDAGSSTVGTNLFGKDYLYEYHRSNLCVISCGPWSSTSDAGVWHVALYYYRADSTYGLGFRLACYSE